jgi:hypothetical protein
MKLRTPGFAAQLLEELHAGGLELLVKCLDRFGRGEAHVRGQQFLAVAQRRVDNGRVHVLEVEQTRVAPDLRIEGRFAIDEDDRETELLREEIAASLDIGHEQFGGGRDYHRAIALKSLGIACAYNLL